MQFELVEPDRLVWPGKLGVIASSENPDGFSLDEWQVIVRRSDQLVSVPSGRRKERATFFFASARDLGRVELVYVHGYVWPVDPPRSGRAIMEELIEHVNDLKKKT
jgi:hypothetical protein